MTRSARGLRPLDENLRSAAVGEKREESVRKKKRVGRSVLQKFFLKLRGRNM